ncbi:DUF2586 family protein [Deinococcus arenicola]|uniref:DUF2586 family protein n=1 Tax=Deinococcus arenicola TaxID=2994950 RepID=A0ABU4DWW0_9DEIO|nr:DUF2586 family protein [Deinococcus sp. ZS9-10]MDV6376370.1 DUF2586 family protein [Deinococcus sp. ZS9-10]
MTDAPKVTVQFEDGNLSLITPSGAGLQAKLGVSSLGAGPARVARLADVRTTFGSGPLASALAVALIESKPVLGIPVPASVTGAPNDATAVILSVTRAAANLAAAAAAVRISVGGTDLGERAVPVSGVLALGDTGLSVTFADGTFVVGDTFSFSATAPGTTLGDVATALEAFLATRTPVRFIHITGTATPALGAAVDALLAAAEATGFYTHAVLDAAARNAGETVAAYDAHLNAQWAAFASSRVSVAKEGGEIYNPLTQRSEVRPASWPATMRRTTRPVGEDASRVRTGYLRGVTAVTVDAGQTSAPGRFISLMTLDGRQGAYVAAWPMMSPDESDYDLVQSREVIDEAARAGRAAALDYMGDDVPVDPDTGRILETEALSIEAFIAGRVSAQLSGSASGVRVVIDREINILSTRRMEYDVHVIPLGYLREIKVRVGYTNPALAAMQLATPSAGNTPGGI